MTRTQFMTVMAAFTTLRQHYNHGETRANITMQRGLKQGTAEFDSAKLSITGPPSVFVAIGGILWGMAASLECHLHASKFGDQATFELMANGESEPSQEECDEVAKRAFGG